MNLAKQDKYGSANGIAAMAVLKLLIETMLKKKLLSLEEAEIVISCAMIEVSGSKGSGDLTEARYLIESLLRNEDVETTKA